MSFFTGTILVFFVLNCLFLILLVMLQSGKGSSGLGGVLGGGSQSVFGSSSADIMTKITRYAGVSFILLSLLLSLLFARNEDFVLPEDPNSLQELLPLENSEGKANEASPIQP